MIDPPPIRDPRDASWIQTHRGGRFYVNAPWTGDVQIRDIAHALAKLCRFGGHCRQFYSVAQHSVIVSRLVPPGLALQGLLHDASEAYLVDMPRPIKRMPGFEIYRECERAVQAVIYRRFDLPTGGGESIDHADMVALATEARDLMPNHEASAWISMPPPMHQQIQPLGPKQALDSFLARAAELGLDTGWRS